MPEHAIEKEAASGRRKRPITEIRQSPWRCDIHQPDVRLKRLIAQISEQLADDYLSFELLLW